MVIKDHCICVLWTKVALALEGLISILKPVTDYGIYLNLKYKFKIIRLNAEHGINPLLLRHSLSVYH